MARMFHNKWSCFIKLKYFPALFIEENVPMNFHFAMAKLFYLFYLIISQTIPKLCVNWAFYLCKKLYTKHFTFSFEWKQDERSKGRKAMVYGVFSWYFHFHETIQLEKFDRGVNYLQTVINFESVCCNHISLLLFLWFQRMGPFISPEGEWGPRKKVARSKKTYEF